MDYTEIDKSIETRVEIKNETVQSGGILVVIRREPCNAVLYLLIDSTRPNP